MTEIVAGRPDRTVTSEDPDTWDRIPNNCELAILHHPDQATPWIVVAVAHVAPVSSADPGGALLEKVTSRLPALCRGLPTVASRLIDGRWHSATGPVPVVSAGGDRTPASMLARFDLATEPPLRLLVDPEGKWMSFFVHHAALDGARLLVAAKMLLCQMPAPAPEPPMPQRGEIPWHVLARLLLPADPVAPSAVAPLTDTFVSRTLPLLGLGVSARLPEACLAAVTEFSAARGRPLRRVGVSLGIARSRGPANVSSYRRVDGRVGDGLGPHIERVLASPDDPWEIRHPPRLVRFAGVLANRLSDTILLTNLGRQSMPGVVRLEGYPVARGRSAVAFGAIRIAGGESTLSLRTRDIGFEDASGIIDDVIRRLSPQ